MATQVYDRTKDFQIPQEYKEAVSNILNNPLFEKFSEKDIEQIHDGFMDGLLNSIIRLQKKL